MCLLGKKLVLWGHIWRGCFQNVVQMIVREATLLLFPKVGPRAVQWASARGPYVVQSRGIACYLWSWALDGGEWWAWCSGRLFPGRVQQVPIEEGVGPQVRTWADGPDGFPPITWLGRPCDRTVVPSNVVSSEALDSGDKVCEIIPDKG